MRKSKIYISVSLILLVLIAGAFWIGNYGQSLKGFFSGIAPSVTTLCPTNASLNTVYVKEGESSGGTGTRRRPYDSVASAQSALESDSTIDRVCFSGEFNESLDLSAALSTDLTLTAYAEDTLISASDLVLNLEDSATENLSISELELEGTVHVGPETSLTISSVIIDGDSRSNALWIGEADTVTISDSTIENAYTGLLTTKFSTDAVGSLTLDNVTFETIYATAIDANYLDTLSVLDSNLTYAGLGIRINEVAAVTVERSVLIGQNANWGLRITDTTAFGTTLDFQNNFVADNDRVFYREGYPSSSSNITANIYSNSFYNNKAALAIEANATAKNNIIYSVGSSGGAFGSTTYSAFVVSDYNLFYGNFAGGVSSLSDWQSRTGQDANSISGDPLFTGTEDLHIGTGSPAIDAGTDLSTVTDDIDGDARSSGSYDIGADEY